VDHAGSQMIWRRENCLDMKGPLQKQNHKAK